MKKKLAKISESHARRRSAPRSRRVASSFPGSSALQAPTEYVVVGVRTNAALSDALADLHSRGWCIHTVLSAFASTGFNVVAWRFTGAK